MLREVKELTTADLFARWQAWYLDRDGDPSSALVTSIELIERLERDRGDAIIGMFYDDHGATGCIGRMLKLTPKPTQHLLDRLFRDRAQMTHANGNGRGNR